MYNAICPLFSLLKKYAFCLVVCCAIFFLSKIYGQVPSYSFQHVTTADGLSNATTRGITQDKYGYIWSGSVNGLSRYNGYSVKTFIHSAADSFSIPENFVSGILNDDADNLWIAFSSGLYGYQYNTGHFILQQPTKGLRISKIVQGPGDAIYLATSAGLAVYHTKRNILELPDKGLDADSKSLLHREPKDLYFYQKRLLYVTTDTGLMVYDPVAKKATLRSLPKGISKPLAKITIDAGGTLWACYGTIGDSIVSLSPDLTSFRFFPEVSKNASNNYINNLFVDAQNRVWAGTTQKGLALYDTTAHQFRFFEYDLFNPQSLSSYNIADIFQDRQGFIWIGTEGYGLNYFHPDKNLFYTVYAGTGKDTPFPYSWGRCVAEDKNGDLWLGTVNGVALYKTNSGEFTVIQNNKMTPHCLYSNSVRCLLYDDKDFLWIGTAVGLNRYNTHTGQVEFFDAKDAVPKSFYKSMVQDQNKDIWIGCRDGLYKFNCSTNRFTHFENDTLFAPLFDKNIQVIYTDRRQQLWFGTSSTGAFVYSRKAGTLQHICSGAMPGTSIRAFAEDSAGNLWMSGNEGISKYQPASQTLTLYNEQQGLTTANTGGLLPDDKNRLWVATGKGLFVLDSARNRFTSFTLKDGLATLEFNEQPAFETTKGLFIFPSLKGFLFFNPRNYQETAEEAPVYISSFKVFNQYIPIGTNPESLTELNLGYDQNFFSFELTGFNYGNPEQTRYAYKLEPFDKDWTHTTERVANYTNVPGGDYMFRYQASLHDNWQLPVKAIQIHVGRIFYKTGWFWTLTALLAAGILYSIYRYRMREKEKIFLLQSKTQVLEKEKAIVQYESLKQQLNPHFLFNSLTSLRSLIRINKEVAAEFLDKLSLNYRYVLRSTDSELVALKDELEFAQTYIDLQQTRFGEGLQVTIDIRMDMGSKKIVPVTVQNLIENAIKHNLTDTDSPLQIRIFQEADYLLVQNNLQVKGFVETSNKYGLKHLQSLYRYLDKRPLVIEKGAAFFTVKIPLL